eukprot:3033872-Ditylum_brightwellii.AAC.1
MIGTKLDVQCHFDYIGRDVTEQESYRTVAADDTGRDIGVCQAKDISSKFGRKVELYGDSWGEHSGPVPIKEISAKRSCARGIMKSKGMYNASNITN